MDLETLKIDLKGLKEGANHLTFDLDDTYFKAIDAPEVSQGVCMFRLILCAREMISLPSTFMRQAWYLCHVISVWN